MVTDNCDSLGLIPISAHTLVPNALIGLDIYLRATSRSKPVLFCADSEPVSIDRIHQIEAEKVGKLFIDRNDYSKYQTYLRSSWQELISDTRQPAVNRVCVMSDLMRSVLHEELRDPSAKNIADIVSASQEMCSVTADVLEETPVLVSQLCDVMHHDYATFTHSTNVAIFATMLAREIGFTADEIKEIAVGALLHDIGKLKIPEGILSKPGRLDVYEMREVQRHPTIGFQLLANQDSLTFGQLMMAYQHHEKADGSGYPVQCLGDEIHPWAKLCTIVDIFEALTSERPYRTPMTHKTALAVLEKERQTVDQEMLKCWAKLVNQS